MKTGTVLTALSLVFSSAMVIGQASTSGPKLDALVGGVSVVSGMATVGSGPIDVYDTSTTTRTKLGSASMTAPDGRFYCALKPALIVGHKVIAIDKGGNVSPVAIVGPKSQSTGRVPK